MCYLAFIEDYIFILFFALITLFLKPLVLRKGKRQSGASLKTSSSDKGGGLGFGSGRAFSVRGGSRPVSSRSRRGCPTVQPPQPPPATPAAQTQPGVAPSRRLRPRRRDTNVRQVSHPLWGRCPTPAPLRSPHSPRTRGGVILRPPTSPERSLPPPAREPGIPRAEKRDHT